MSYTTIFKVPESGSIEPVAEFGNAFRGAMIVWMGLSKKYLGLEMPPIFSEEGMNRLWNLAKDESVEYDDRLVLCATFDRVMVRRETIPVIVEAFRAFGNRHEDAGHLPQQADFLEKLYNEDENFYAVCWNQTSVNSDAWMVRDGEDEDGDAVYRYWDISKDTGHWFLEGAEDDGLSA